MALFYLMSDVHMPIDSRYVQSYHLYIQNFGDRSFDLLVQSASPDRMLLLGLQRMYAAGMPASTYTAHSIFTGYQPFHLQIATNIRNKNSLGIMLEFLQGDTVVARVTHEHSELNKLD
ncbi:hypothetical protein SAMN02799630_02753 [Paenibacillus sp. UNCCL117]|nr:hypothetical protein SAMN04488602_107215 [Paenibacillus sp. cl123]SFW40280.1 hypothetical protein SAMN02799630_02753 [Paenibacillus sp. UNCCL117]